MPPQINITNEDCMNLMARYPDKYFDLAIVDPPYGIDINSSGRLGHYGGKKNWDSEIPEREYFDELRRISKNQIVWGGNYFPHLWKLGCRGFVIWDKEQPEAVSFESCEFAWSSFNQSAKTFYLRPQGEDRIHPTQKPVKLYKWLIDKYAKPGDKILDTHLGSGSIAIACHDYGFDLTACELDPDYYAAAMKRLKNHKAQIKLAI